MDETLCSLRSLENKKCKIFADPIVSNEQISNKKLRKRLMVAVQRRRELYDPRHKNFTNTSVKNDSWKKISEKLDVNVDVCTNTWFNMRYTFQKNVRSLHPLYRITKRATLRKILKNIEPEIYFLWPFVNKVSTDSFRSNKIDCKKNKQTALEDNRLDKCEDVITLDSDSEIIAVDDLEDEIEKEYSEINPQVQHLVDLVRIYPELYNKKHRSHNDLQRKCIIWYEISKNVMDKATKLIKLWIHLVTRYEFELDRSQFINTPMQQLLCFLRPYIGKNSFTVYKLSYYLKKDWYEPIKYFRDICRFVEIIKKNIDVVCLSETLMEKFKENPDSGKKIEQSYIEKWEELSKNTHWSSGCLEVTWLTLRVFYEEISDMRKVGYKFQDKWFFESAMAEIMCKIRIQLMPKENLTNSREQTNAHSLIRSDHMDDMIKNVNMPQKANYPTLLKKALVESTSANQSCTSSAQPDSITSTSIHLNAYNLSDQQDTSTFRVNSTSKNTTSLNSCTNSHNFPNLIGNSPDTINNIIPASKPLSIIPINTIAYGPQDFLPVPNYNPTKNTSALPTKPPNVLPSNLRTNEPQITLPVPDQQIPHISSTLQAINFKNIPQFSVPSMVSCPDPSQMHADKSKFLPDYQIPHISSTLQPTNINHNIQKTLVAKICDSVPSRNVDKSQNNSPLPNHQIPHISSTLPAINLNNTDPLRNVHKLHDLQLNSSLPEHQIPHITSSFQPMHLKNSTQGVLASSTDVREPFISGLKDKHSTPINYKFREQNPLLIDLTDEISSVDETHTPKRASYIPTIKQNINEVRFILTMSTGLLIIQRPPLIERNYSLSLTKVGKFVREVMAIPQLLIKNSANITYWRHIEKKFDMPIRICQACWTFLSNHTDFFHLFGSMDELLKSSKSDKDFWKTSYVLFKKFDEMAVNKGWIKYYDHLPKVIKKISQYPCLHASTNTTTNLTSETKSTWREIIEHYPEITDLPEIWAAFKEVYMQYILELENGIHNKWPLKWWRVLMSMQFLLKQKYKRLEPMYFIVLNKINEEIERCVSLEKKVDAIQNDQMNALETLKLIKNIRAYSAIYLPKYSAKEKALAWNELAKKMHFSVELCMMRFCSAYRQFRMYVAQDTEKRCSFNQKYFSDMKYIHDCVNEERLSKLKIRTPMEVNSSIDQNTLRTGNEEEPFLPNNPDSNMAMTQICNVLDTLVPDKTLHNRILGIFNKYIKH